MHHATVRPLAPGQPFLCPVAFSHQTNLCSLHSHANPLFACCLVRVQMQCSSFIFFLPFPLTLPSLFGLRLASTMASIQSLCLIFAFGQTRRGKHGKQETGQIYGLGVSGQMQTSKQMGNKREREILREKSRCSRLAPWRLLQMCCLLGLPPRVCVLVRERRPAATINQDNRFLVPFTDATRVCLLGCWRQTNAALPRQSKQQWTGR